MTPQEIRDSIAAVYFSPICPVKIAEADAVAEGEKEEPRLWQYPTC
jgi:hypothetical protein